MATDTVDAVIVELKKATIYGKRVYRGWPPVAALEPCCGVQETEAGIATVDRALALWSVQIDSWCKTPADIVAVKAAVKVVADTYHSTVIHRCLPESGNTHIVSTFDVPGGS